MGGEKSMPMPKSTVLCLCMYYISLQIV